MNLLQFCFVDIERIGMSLFQIQPVLSRPKYFAELILIAVVLPTANNAPADETPDRITKSCKPASPPFFEVGYEKK